MFLMQYVENVTYRHYCQGKVLWYNRGPSWPRTNQRSTIKKGSSWSELYALVKDAAAVLACFFHLERNYIIDEWHW